MPTWILTILAMIAFAANSVLCRLALAGGLIDAASFTSIRILSGTLALAFVIIVRKPSLLRARPNFSSSISLFIYMVFFSYAYMSLNTGTGALLLFGFVQITMFWAALSRGEKFPPLAWAGLGLAVLGMAYLLAPGISAPDPFYALLMAIAGIAWGIYSLLGKNASDPTANTATNFLYAALPAFILGIYGLNTSTPSLEGVALAAASGVVASALGYAIWYKAIKELRRTTAATVQLSVPAIAAIAGVIFLAEPISTRIIIAVTLTLVGIGTIIRVQQKEKYNGDGVEGQRI